MGRKNRRRDDIRPQHKQCELLEAELRWRHQQHLERTNSTNERQNR